LLRDIEIKSSLLDKFDVPLSMYAGYIGRLAIQIPWKQLVSQPIQIEMDDVHILLGTDLDKPVVEEDPKEAEKKKQALLKELEEQAKQEFSKSFRKHQGPGHGGSLDLWNMSQP
jgi:hypothetical protein